MALNRLLFPLPIPYSPDGGFWTRDAGLMVLTLREMGYDAWLVALGDASTVTEGMPVLTVSLEDLSSAAWWKAQRPDGAVLTTWSAPRFDRMRKAALQATPRVLERLDSSGARSARLFPGPYYLQTWVQYAEDLPPWLRFIAFPIAAARTALLYSFPSLMDERMAATMRQLPGLLAESPIAAERIRRMIERFSPPAPRIETIAHPVNESIIRRTDGPKENRIITVGRWAAVQKDFPLLRKVLRDFLQDHPDWEATVVGSGVPENIARSSSHEKWEERVTYHNKMSHQELSREYNRAKIYLMVSRHESFCIAAAEALCCGVSVVGSRAVPSSYYFAETNSGTVAARRTRAGFRAALGSEVQSWNTGARDPAAVALEWHKRAGCFAVARRTLEFLESIAIE
jgi:glycosyltransferase involved in cell wall biosynthesis